MRGHSDKEQLESMGYKDLQALAKDLGVSAGGKAEEIIARIAAAEANVPEGGLTEAEKALFDAGHQEKAAAEMARQEEEQAAALQEALKEWEKETEKEAAGLVKVKVVTRFLDKRLNQIKDVGEAYSVSRQRAAELVIAGVAEIQQKKGGIE